MVCRGRCGLGYIREAVATTAKMASELNRNWIYIEKVKEYCEIAERRLEL